ncbi:hypothetical protein GCM10007216_04360 [Thalassobacillus devorans]|uniref:Aspartate kinase n=1 Tax=Thalassobacillus devorans TaxID=279813 RepID=A0ABQ1NH28_9BACI|nr:hypothetical protein [Thalassobacillus devorans]GGC76998.1 hypothetical protein GCM10007216_04360 [Thalassobacillus devorans]
MLSKLLKYLKENSWKTIYVTQDTYDILVKSKDYHKATQILSKS